MFISRTHAARECRDCYCSASKKKKQASLMLLSIEWRLHRDDKESLSSRRPTNEHALYTESWPLPPDVYCYIIRQACRSFHKITWIRRYSLLVLTGKRSRQTYSKHSNRPKAYHEAPSTSVLLSDRTPESPRPCLILLCAWLQPALLAAFAFCITTHLPRRGGTFFK